jgi:predicted ATP-grasp superfamily ATP-dependent carboligase
LRGKPEAIVVGAGVNALGVVRSLAPEGLRITVVDDGARGPARYSRFATVSEYKGDLVDHLRELGARPERPVLFLTQEAAVAAVSAGRDRLQDRLRFVLPKPDLLDALRNKSRFEALASRFGFAVPRSAVLAKAGEVERVAPFVYPCILKPVAKSREWDKRFKKAYRFDSFDALRRFFVEKVADAPATVIVQEWIEGADSDVYFTFVFRNDRGQTAVAFTGRKIRQWPPQIGGTASCMPAPAEHEQLLNLTTRFFDAVEFIGMGSMEYKKDPRSGRFVMVEPTVGRTDYQEEVATLNGVNVVRAAYRSLAGLEPLPRQAVPALQVWVDRMGDERSKAAQPGAAAPEEAARARWVDALFRLNDPGPWLADMQRRLTARVGMHRS